jgi:hypothetical protein
MRQALRAAGYAEEAIEEIGLRLNRAATSARGLSELLLTSSGDEAAELIGMMRDTLPLESYAMRTVPGSADPVRRLVQRPREVLDFLLGSDPAAVAAFRSLRQTGWSAGDARTIMTLARNGRSVEEVTQAVAAGRTLDDLVAETLFQAVGAEQAHELSGIPRTFLSGRSIDDVAALARQEGVDILVRDANQGLEATMRARWPKDPAAQFVFGGTEVKVASIPQETAEGVIRFKTDRSTRVVLQVQDPATGAWASRDLFVVHKPEGWALVPGSELATMPEDWWAMGGDIDLLAVLQKGDGGYTAVGAETARDLALRAELNGIATVPAGLPDGEVPGLVMHGSALPYFNTTRTWSPALVFTAEGRMVWLNGDDAVEYWLKLRGVSSEPYARYSEAVGWLAGRPVPFSSAGYLAGTVVSNLPELGAALPAAAGDPAAGADATAIPVGSSTPVPRPPPEPPPTATPTPGPSGR